MNKYHVRNLIIWVHPHYGPFYEDEESKKSANCLVERISESRDVALIVTGGDIPENRYSEFEEFNQFADGRLGYRYIFWDESRFISGREGLDRIRLIDTFKLKQEDQTRYIPKNVRGIVPSFMYLAQTYIFGQLPGTCPVAQATKFDLQLISSCVKSGETYPCSSEPNMPTKQNLNIGGSYCFQRYQ